MIIDHPFSRGNTVAGIRADGKQTLKYQPQDSRTLWEIWAGSGSTRDIQYDTVVGVWWAVNARGWFWSHRIEW